MLQSTALLQAYKSGAKRHAYWIVTQLASLMRACILLVPCVRIQLPIAALQHFLASPYLGRGWQESDQPYNATLE